MTPDLETAIPLLVQLTATEVAAPRSGLDPVVLVQDRGEWPLMFECEAALIRCALGASVVRLEHIGSTAVPDLVAKPVIDIDVAVARELEPSEILRLAVIGYTFLGEYGLAGRAFFRKGDPYTHHLHVFVDGHPELQRHLVFRDWLLAHSQSRREYAVVKKRLARRLRDDRAAYTAAKAPFIVATLQQAMAAETDTQ